MTLIDGCDYVVREVPLPLGVHGMSRPDEEGIVNIYINANETREEQIKTFFHELAHVSLGHFGSSVPLSVREAEAEKGAFL